MSVQYDVIVVGAGAAGLTTSASLAEKGIKVLTLDEQNRLGGQIYKNIEHASAVNLEKMGEEYRRGQSLAKRFRKSGADYLNNATVWNVESNGRVCYSRNGSSERIDAKYVVLATGAIERPMPFPGWNLPGVLGAGAVNGLAKDSNLVPFGKVVLAGSGPLLLLEAALLIEKKVDVVALLETTPQIPSLGVFPHVPQAILGTKFLLKGLKMLLDIHKSKIPHYKNITGLSAHGSEKVERVTAMSGNKILDFKTDILLSHFGVIPDTHMYRLIGCSMKWDEKQRYWYPKTDSWGRTNFENIFAVGDANGVSGALAAEFKGELAALEIAHCFGIIPKYERDILAEEPHANLRQDGHPRPLIDAFFAPNPKKFAFKDSTVLCRCENITVGRVREIVREGVIDVNEIKAITRCGMGPCQGRMCGPALGEVVAAELEIAVPRTGLLTVRPPLKPIPLEELATMPIEADAVDPANLFKNQSKK